MTLGEIPDCRLEFRVDVRAIQRQIRPGLPHVFATQLSSSIVASQQKCATERVGDHEVSVSHVRLQVDGRLSPAFLTCAVSSLAAVEGACR